MSSNAAAVSPDTAQNPEPHKPQSLYQKKRHTSDIVLRIVIYTATAITVAALKMCIRDRSIIPRAMLARCL